MIDPNSKITEPCAQRKGVPRKDVPTYNLPEVDRKRTIGAVVFTHGRSAEVGGRNGITSDSYLMLHMNKCYELSFSIAESSFSNPDPSEVKEFTARTRRGFKANYWRS